MDLRRHRGLEGAGAVASRHMAKTKQLTPNTLTLRKLQSEGWLAGICEQRIPGTFITRDYLHVADIVALGPGGVTMLVQCTGDNGGNVSARVKKLTEHPADWDKDALSPAQAARKALEFGHRVEVWGWRDDGRLRIVPITLDSYASIG